jgi:hypothetical protein
MKITNDQIKRIDPMFKNNSKKDTTNRKRSVL